MAHTDVGSLTLLFTSTPGLQVFRHSTNKWDWVTPPANTVVVNVGDTLRFLTNSALKSCVHRVVPYVKKDSNTTTTRYSLAYFHRPELKAKFADAEGKEWTGEKWHCTKYKIFRSTNDEQKGNSLLTGKKNFLGDLEKDF